MTGSTVALTLPLLQGVPLPPPPLVAVAGAVPLGKEALAEGQKEAAALGELEALAEGQKEAGALGEFEALVEGHCEATPLSEFEALVEGHNEAKPLTELEGLQLALPEGLRLPLAVALAVPLPPLADRLGLLVPVGALPVLDVATDGDALPQKVPLPDGEPQLDAVGEAVAAAERVGAVRVAPPLAESASEALLVTLPDAHGLAEPESATVALAAALPVEKGDVETVAEGMEEAQLLAVPVTEAAGVDEPPPLRRGPGEPDELTLRVASAALGDGQAVGERLKEAEGEKEWVPEALPLVDGETVDRPLPLLVLLREEEAHAQWLALAQAEGELLRLCEGLREGKGLPLPPTEALAGAGLLLPLSEGRAWLPLVVTLAVAPAEEVRFAVALPKK